MCKVIRFNYLHRDSGNWKKFGSKLFSNSEHLCIDEIELLIRQNLIDQEYFYPEKVGIKKFKFHRYLDDCSWYEFESLVAIDFEIVKVESIESIQSFLEKLKIGKRTS